MGKRFHTMISFNPDTGLKELLDKVIDYTLLMKDFQIKELLTADPLPLISTDITTIFQHMYPTDCAIALIESVSCDSLH